MLGYRVGDEFEAGGAELGGDRIDEVDRSEKEP